MACRCSRGPRVFLPFLYPSLFNPNGAQIARASLTVNGKRCSSTEAPAPNDPATSTHHYLNPSPDDYSMPNFADKAKLSLYAGAGGHGCISFLREAYMDDGPPNGGDGGHGGSIYIQAVHGETSLHKLARRKFIRAGKGKTGQGSSKGGQRGDDVLITVPVGTIVRELGRNDPEAEVEIIASHRMRRRKKQPSLIPAEMGEDGEPIEDPDRAKWILYPGISSSEAKRISLPPLPNRDRLLKQPKAPLYLDLSRATPRPILLAAGALGGLGNPHFASRERPKPMFATRGEQAISMDIEMELKLLADVGLVGLPNAGKSTLLRAISNSRARVGHWEFTTLQPNIGTVVLDNNKGRPLVKSYRQVDRTSDDPWAVNLPEPERQQRTRFTIADIPGLIEGAHLDRGLGIAFLRHVERAGVLAFVVDLNNGNAVKALKALWMEVGLYAQMREEEEQQRKREAQVDWSSGLGEDNSDNTFWTTKKIIEEAGNSGGLHIAGKPWFVVATKCDLPGTQANFEELREYLAAITRGDEPHPSGVEDAWTKDCSVIPVSAINKHGIDRVIHWTVGLLDG
ncbi:GTPase MTG2, mitochondrial [Cladorrhinum sp. PSN332]|nr:GTPase MTG2, mitochondrial [Cladorrhinum sp. PSN332]